MEKFTRDVCSSRRVEEAAWRRYQAAAWLESLVGPLNLPSHPTEAEFISQLRNGLVLCNCVNKIYPGTISKVVRCHPSLLSQHRNFQPLTAYQYFENVKNFLVAIAELNLPGFEASDLERDPVDSNSASKVVDCILALKRFYEGGKVHIDRGLRKSLISPAYSNSENCPVFDLCATTETIQRKNEDFFVKKFVEHIIESKENISNDRLKSLCNGDLIKSVLENFIQGANRTVSAPTPPHMAFSISEISTSASQCYAACLKRSSCDHRRSLQILGCKLNDLKMLLSNTKKEFDTFQFNLESNLKELEIQVQQISAVARGYYSVLKENRKLSNLVEDLKGNIRVFCRVRPSFLAGRSSVVNFAGDGRTIVVSNSSNAARGKRLYHFDRVFGPSAAQDVVFAEIQALIRSVMGGCNVCIFAYGQTGSGKTYTMSGPTGDAAKEKGMNILALSTLFRISEEREDSMSYDIRLQMVEIYNEQVRDLLPEVSAISKSEILPKDGSNLPELASHAVKSTRDALRLTKVGEINRAAGRRSSRSHCILTITVEAKEKSGGTLKSSLHLVDLAGSEREGTLQGSGDKLLESHYVNKSLSALEDVIAASAQKSNHIPCKMSKLTHLLQDSLGGNAKVSMLVHVCPESDSYGETISTLEFAQRVSGAARGVPRASKESLEVSRLKEQVESLKKALAKQNAEGGMMMATPTKVRRLSFECPITEKKPPADHSKTPKTVANPLKENLPAASRIRTSLRSLGKLLNGSEKRMQSKAEERRTPPSSPLPSNSRPARRQSLAGVLPSTPSTERSQGTSLGQQILRGFRTPPPKPRRWI